MQLPEDLHQDLMAANLGALKRHCTVGLLKLLGVCAPACASSRVWMLGVCASSRVWMLRSQLLSTLHFEAMSVT